MKKQNYLTAEKTQDLAHEVLKIKTDIELIRSMSNTFPSMHEMQADEVNMHYSRAHEYFNLLFSKFQDIEDELDDIGATLFAVDDLLDLKSYVRDEHINFPDNKEQ